jgi:hypothetical protein
VKITSFPYELKFDANDYGNALFVRTEDGATHEWRRDAGWSGGAAKFTPNTLSDNSYMGLGQFTFFNYPQERIHIRYLVKFGTAWDPGNGNVKMAVVARPEPGVDNPDMQARERPMLGLSRLVEGSPPYRTFCAAGGGGFRCHNATNEYPWPSGNDPLKVGPPSVGVDEWISVELEASTVPGEPVKVYIYTQDGRVAYGEGNPYATYDLHYHGRPFRYIDIIGYNNGVAPNSDPNNYYMVDELRVDTHYIGPPDGFVEGADPSPSSENSYIMLNPRMTSASVMSLSDNNRIVAGNTTLNLDLYERGSLSSSTGVVLTPGMVISGTGPFDLGSLTSATDTPAHVSMLGTEFVVPHLRNRYRHMYYMLSPNGAANVQINIAGDVYQRSLPQGEMVAFDAGDRNGISTVITSDAPIIVSHRGDLEGNRFADANPVPPAADELWGVRSSGAFIGAVEDNTIISIYASNGTSRNITLNAGAIANVGPTGASANQGRGDAIHIVANKSIGAVQFADGDGEDQTAFYPTSLLHERFGIPKDSQYIAVVCPESGTNVTLYRPDKQPETLSCNANGSFPGKAYFGRSDANVVTIPQGSYLESNKAIHVIYEVSGSEDEHNLVGTSANL